jgi:hypothetical protein
MFADPNLEDTNLFSLEIMLLVKLNTCNNVSNEGTSAASLCRQMAALVPDMFCNF